MKHGRLLVKEGSTSLIDSNGKKLKRLSLYLFNDVIMVFKTNKGVLSNASQLEVHAIVELEFLVMEDLNDDEKKVNF